MGWSLDWFCNSQLPEENDKPVANYAYEHKFLYTCAGVTKQILMQHRD